MTWEAYGSAASYLLACVDSFPLSIGLLVIHIDSSELRPASRLNKHYDKLKVNLETEVVKGLEAKTGADLLVSKLHAPATTSSLIKMHIEAGAFLVQLKFGSDIASSLGGRLKDSLWKMRETGARRGQCIMLFIGQLGVTRGGTAMIDGRDDRPRRQYMAVNKAMLKWGLRGGLALNLTRGSYLVEWLGMLEGEIGQVGEQYWQTHKGMFETDDVLQPLEKIEDWRPALAAIKGVGPKRATNLRNAILAEGALDTLGQALIWTSSSKSARKRLPKIPLWGEGTYGKVRAAVVGEDVEGELCWRIEGME